MHFNKNITGIMCFALSLLPIQLEACTLVFWNTNGISPIVGRTMDLYRDDKPDLVIYPRGIKREGGTADNNLTWTSKYGSVVVTALNTENTSEGLNEAGLSASLLYLNETSYETRDFSKPGLSVGLWAQYLLDNYKTVSEALTALPKFQVISTEIGGRTWPIHLAIQDKNGDMAIIEFVQGEMKIHHGPQYRVFANDPTYDIQLNNLKRYKLFHGTLPMPGDTDSLSRFVRASSYLKTLPQPKDETEAATLLMGVMRTVMVPAGAEDTSDSKLEDAWPTRWVTIKDLKHQVFYMHLVSTPNMIWLDLHTLHFKKGNPILHLELDQSGLVGDVEKQLHELNDK